MNHAKTVPGWVGKRLHVARQRLWSLAVATAALHTAAATAFGGAVIFSEILYNPSGNDGFRTRGKNTEWIELFNGATNPVDISGWKLYKVSRSGRITLLGQLAAGTVIAAGGTVVIVPAGLATPDDFRSAWQISAAVPVTALVGWNGTSRMGLPNSGATLRLVDTGGDVADELNYRAPGFPASRNGWAIEFVAEGIDPNALADANDVPSRWRHATAPIPAPGIYASVRFGARDRGTPGAARVTPTPEPPSLAHCLLLLALLLWLYPRLQLPRASHQP